MRSTNLKSAIDCHIVFIFSGCWIQKRKLLVSFGGIHILRLLKFFCLFVGDTVDGRNPRPPLSINIGINYVYLNSDFSHQQ